MKKRFLVISLMLLCFIFFIGCNKIDSLIENNSDNDTEDNIDLNKIEAENDIVTGIEESNDISDDESEYFWQKEMADDTAVVIVNNITDQEYDSLSNIENIILDDTGEKITLVSALDNVNVEIWSLEYIDDELTCNELIHQRKNMKKNEAINIEVIVPEGIPSYMIKGECDKGQFEYSIAYDGLNGNSHLEGVSYSIKEDDSDIKEKTVIAMNCRIFFFDTAELKEYYIDKEIQVENKEVIRALTNELKKSTLYNEDFLELDDKVEITSAKVEDGTLKVVFSKDYISSIPSASEAELGLLNAIIDTYGYNLSVDKVAIYFGDELYTCLDDEFKDGYFYVDYSDAEEFIEN